MSIADRSAPHRLALAALLLGAAAPALAQSAPTGSGAVPQRVDRLEKEMRAVQRKVFPDGEQAMLAPEISAPADTAAGGTPAGAPIADLTARVSSLEQALAQLTGQVEQNGFRLKQLEDQFARFKTDADAPLRSPASGDGAPAGTISGADRPAPTRPRPATTDALETGAQTAIDTGTPPVGAGADTGAGPAATPTPTSADPAEESYLVGYRAWTAKDYSSAETALKAYLAKYPAGKRASYAQNLLGRTYLDSGRPAAAAVAFHHNYTTMPRGDRAPDSLYYLGQSLMKLEKPQPAKACEAYDTLNREYGATMGATLKDRSAKAREEAKCDAVG